MPSTKFAYLMEHRGLTRTKSVNAYANDAFVTLHVKRFKYGDGENIRRYIIRRTAATSDCNRHRLSSLSQNVQGDVQLSHSFPLL
jgi:hypothetical protein